MRVSFKGFSGAAALRRGVLVAAGAASLLGLSACTEGFDTSVTRFSVALPAPAGQSFAVVAGDPSLAGGIEFGQYARAVAGDLVKLGYHEAPAGQPAQLVVRLDYGVDKGREKVEADPSYGPWVGYHPRGWAGGWTRRAAWGYGWYDPWFNEDVRAYTVYTSGVVLKIDDASGKRLFEGRAEAVSTSNRLSYLVPNLIEALFVDFPGNSGQTVRITIAPEKVVKPAAPAANSAGAGK